MHEYSVMSQLVKIAEGEARKHHAKKVLEITLELGELTLLLKPQLEFAFEVLSPKTILEGARLDIRDIEARLSCPGCRTEGTMKELELKDTGSYYAHFIPLVCPNCSKKLDVVKGKEFTIKEMKMDV